MKNLYFILSLLLVASCSPKMAPSTSVSLVERDAQGLVTINATGFGASQAEREASAQKKVFETILFKGLPSASSSALRLPMIEKEDETRAAHPDFFHAFFEEQKMSAFVQSISLNQQKAKGVNGQEFSMKINYDALRKHLEEKGIIRKFGY